MKEGTSGEQRSDSDATAAHSETTFANLERLLRWFQENEARLRAWVGESEQHAQLLLVDPASAVEGADLYLDPELVPELSKVSAEIAKIKEVQS